MPGASLWAGLAGLFNPDFAVVARAYGWQAARGTHRAARPAPHGRYRADAAPEARPRREYHPDPLGGIRDAAQALERRPAQHQHDATSTRRPSTKAADHLRAPPRRAA
jgi:hypothetical protein